MKTKKYYKKIRQELDTLLDSENLGDVDMTKERTQMFYLMEFACIHSRIDRTLKEVKKLKKKLK